MFDLRDGYDRLAASISLGYGCIAHNVVVEGPLNADHKCPVQLLDPKLIKQGESSRSEKFRELLEGKRQLKQLKRLTLVTEEISESQCLHSKNPVLEQYDLVAIQPMSTAVAEQACAALDIDLITVDLTNHLPFNYKQYWLRKAAERGIHIELCYSKALKDTNQRQRFFSGARKFYDWTRGKNLIVSSGADDRMELRAPYDVINLTTFLGLKEKHAKESISHRCAEIVRNAQSRKTMFKGAVLIESIPLEDSDDVEKDDVESSDSMDTDFDSDSAPKETKEKMQKKNPKNIRQGGIQKKRKNKPQSKRARKPKRLSSDKSQKNPAGY
ncbi:hypothetical protein BSKO_12286 [Bryopsis sp. KO-2023]|nr:hypothetical protein BSKO_12286 [Bryopsis sp. KO-2023]